MLVLKSISNKSVLYQSPLVIHISPWSIVPCFIRQWWRCQICPQWKQLPPERRQDDPVGGWSTRGRMDQWTRGAQERCLQHWSLARDWLVPDHCEYGWWRHLAIKRWRPWCLENTEVIWTKNTLFAFSMKKTPRLQVKHKFSLSRPEQRRWNNMLNQTQTCVCLIEH